MSIADFILGIQAFDLSFLTMIEGLRTPFGVFFFETVTMLANWYAVFLVVAVFGMFWMRTERARLAQGMVLSVASAETLSYALKFLVARPRPLHALIPQSTASFPSGHAVIAVSLYGFLAWSVWSRAKTDKGKRAAVFGGTLLAFLIGFSRLYLGVHYLSDVLAGYLIGIAGLRIAILYVTKNNSSKYPKE